MDTSTFLLLLFVVFIVAIPLLAFVPTVWPTIMQVFKADEDPSIKPVDFSTYMR